MRDRLSQLLVQSAKADPKFIVLSGDHGYALFDDLRRECPNQFLNCGVAEQGMVGIAAGLAKEGYRPVVYGLAAFIPMRVIEQIKLDVCHANLPITFIGDGAGLVYSYLGASHQCAEDIAALMPLPNISIYSPADSADIELCFREAIESSGPSYIRLGKCDRASLKRRFQYVEDYSPKLAIVSTGSMSDISERVADELKLPFYSIRKLKPFQGAPYYQKYIVIEEHSEYGGLASILRNHTSSHVRPIALKDQFSDRCGSWQYALSEHEMDDMALRRRIKQTAEHMLV